jgi:hypothetical protein
MRRAPRVDESHVLIVEALRAAGASVLSLAAVGKGCPDVLIGYAGVDVLAELKNDPKLVKDKRRTKPAAHQETWHAGWRGRSVSVLRSPEEALQLIRAISAELARAGCCSSCGQRLACDCIGTRTP